MNKSTAPAWMDKLADGVEAALASSGIDKDEAGAAIFIAVHQNPDGTKLVSHHVTGCDLPLAEAIGTLVYNRDLPPVIYVAASKALEMRNQEDEARILRACRGTKPANKHNKPQNKKRK